MMMTTARPFLMFQGNAKEAIDYYVDNLDFVELRSLEIYREDEGGKVGTVKSALLKIDGIEYYVKDNPVEQPFDFTPSFSIFITADTIFEQEQIFNKLKRKGMILMPNGEYGFSRAYGWCIDQFGLSWQVSVKDDLIH